MNKTVNLNECVPGQLLRSKHGMILTYIGKNKDPKWPHEVQYPDGGCGTRTNDGFVYSNPNSRQEQDHDIAEVLPV